MARKFGRPSTGATAIGAALLGLLAAAPLAAADASPPAASPAAVAHAHGSDSWAEGGYAGAQTSYNPGEHSLTPATTKHLEKKWGIATGSAGGAVQGKLFYASLAGGIYAKRISNGHKVRHYKVTKPYLTPGAPLMDGKRMIFANGSNLEAVSLKSGKRLWRIVHKNTGANIWTWSPYIRDGATVYAVLTKFVSTTSTSTTKLLAINAATGKQKWVRPALYGPIAASGGQVYAQGTGDNVGPGAYDHIVAAMNAATGHVQWIYQEALIQNVTGITVSGSTVLAGAGGSVYGDDLYALSASTGGLLWSYKDPTNAVAPAGQSFVTDGTRATYLSSNGHLVALSLASGHKVWQHKADLRTAVGGGGVVYSYTQNGHIHAFRLSDGKALWTSGQKFAVPYLVSRGRLIGALGGVSVSGFLAFGRK